MFQEPGQAAQNDVEVISRVLGSRQVQWERGWEERRAQLEQHLQRCQFDADLHQLNQQLADLATQLGRVKGQFGESLATARANAQAFVAFERTIEVGGVNVFVLKVASISANVVLILLLLIKKQENKIYLQYNYIKQFKNLQKAFFIKQDYKNW